MDKLTEMEQQRRSIIIYARMIHRLSAQDPEMLDVFEHGLIKDGWRSPLRSIPFSREDPDQGFVEGWIVAGGCQSAMGHPMIILEVGCGNGGKIGSNLLAMIRPRESYYIRCEAPGYLKDEMLPPGKVIITGWRVEHWFNLIEEIEREL